MNRRPSGYEVRFGRVRELIEVLDLGVRIGAGSRKGKVGYPIRMGDPTAKVTLELPMEVFSALRRSPEEFGREMRLIAAIYWYTRDDVSMEKAAMIAGLNRRDFLLELAARKVDVFKVDAEDLERELARA